MSPSVSQESAGAGRSAAREAAHTDSTALHPPPVGSARESHQCRTRHRLLRHGRGGPALPGRPARARGRPGADPAGGRTRLVPPASRQRARAHRRAQRHRARGGRERTGDGPGSGPPQRHRLGGNHRRARPPGRGRRRVRLGDPGLHRRRRHRLRLRPRPDPGPAGVLRRGPGSAGAPGGGGPEGPARRHGVVGRGAAARRSDAGRQLLRDGRECGRYPRGLPRGTEHGHGVDGAGAGGGERRRPLRLGAWRVRPVRPRGGSGLPHRRRGGRRPQRRGRRGSARRSPDDPRLTGASRAAA